MGDGEDKEEQQQENKGAKRAAILQSEVEKPRQRLDGGDGMRDGEEEEEEEELQNNNRVVDILLTDSDFEEEEDAAEEEEHAAEGDERQCLCLLPCRELTTEEIRAADQVMKRIDLDAVLFTKYSIPIRVRDLHRAAQPGTWGPGGDARYYLNDELVNYWFKMLNTKLDERAFAGTRESGRKMCACSAYIFCPNSKKICNNALQRPGTGGICS
jgi:hypothetical protein